MPQKPVRFWLTRRQENTSDTGAPIQLTQSQIVLLAKNYRIQQAVLAELGTKFAQADEPLHVREIIDDARDLLRRVKLKSVQ